MRGFTSIAVAGLVATALVAPPASASFSAADPAPTAAGADFNLDGFEDVVTGLPDYTVDGQAAAGAVQVILGGGEGSFLITQNTEGVPDEAEAGDRFGQSVTAWYSPYDNYPNLVVGVPGESVGDKAGAGMIHVFQGHAGGIFLDGYTYDQDSGGMPGVAEAGDMFGWSLSGNIGGGGYRYGTLAIGAPGEDDNAVDAGSVYLIGNERIKVFSQDTAGIPGTQEKGDRFGWSVSILRDVLVVGVPYESIGSVAGAGLVQVFTVRRSATPNTDWPKPQPVVNLDQSMSGVAGVPETGDHFGMSVSIASEEGGESTDYDFAVGVPDEDIGSVANAGGVHEYELEDPYADSSPAWSEHMAVNQGSTGVPGKVETGDRFGSTVDAFTTVWGTTALTVASAGEGTDADIGTVPAIHVFSRQLHGGGAAWVRAGKYTVPGGETLSTVHLEGGPETLRIAAPDSTRILGVPWENVLYGQHSPLVVHSV
ncbi:FG-GAP repeat protein [Phytomonospora endophytica]|uniref:Uncharacterized protein n=1 Tax=Phytomonospora endophytica TaxID=714109 RepID=A0A841FTH2_9ACTN|nr:FG-GAP repeat protein [Phytomonospora endophytica]MBB6036842.1 hypothetical protein [Phytomonospora endophytica]GIG68124.1 hypothetical protein Pen01_44190 [Phytomonospora endophytica]